MILMYLCKIVINIVEVDFSSLRRFRNSLTAKVLAWYCSLNFV